MTVTVVAFCLLVALGSGAVARSASRRLRRMERLEPAAGPPGERFRIGVVIPARNEARGLEAALRSVLAQRGVELRVVVVDDHSTDATGAIADALALEDPRLTVLHDPPLRPGWLGKANAMQAGAAAVAGDLLLFTDADVRHHPDGFASFARTLEARKLDFISGLPLVEAVSLWENVNTPIFLFGMGTLDRALESRQGKGASQALAAGALMLFRAECFGAIGGFEPVKGKMLDDLSTAQVLRRAGRPTGFRLATGCMRVRLFHGNREAFWGPTKNILTVVEGREWMALPLLLVSAAQFWVPPAAAAWGLAAGEPLLAAAGLVAYAAQYLGLLVARPVFDFDPLKAAAFPLVVVSVSACMGKALYHRLRGEIHWRGRSLRVEG